MTDRQVITYENVALLQGGTGAYVTGSNSGLNLEFVKGVQSLGFSIQTNNQNVGNVGSRKIEKRSNMQAADVGFTVTKLEDFDDLFTNVIPYGDFNLADFNRDRNFYALIGDQRGNDVSGMNVSGSTFLTFGNCFLDNVSISQSINGLLESQYSFLASNVEARQAENKVVYFNDFEQYEPQDSRSFGYIPGLVLEAHELEDGRGLTISNTGFGKIILGTGEGILETDVYKNPQIMDQTIPISFQTTPGKRTLVIYDGAVTNGISFSGVGNGFDPNAIYEVSGTFGTNMKESALDIAFITGDRNGVLNDDVCTQRYTLENSILEEDPSSANFRKYVLPSSGFSVTGNFGGSLSGALSIRSAKLDGGAGINAYRNLTGSLVTWSGDSTFSFVPKAGGITWIGAYEDAIAQGGRLACPDTIARFDKFSGDIKAVQNFRRGWLGLTDTGVESNTESTDALQRAKFKWLNGFDNTITGDIYWYEGEPNDTDDNQDFIHLQSDANHILMNDARNDQLTVTGYYLEQITTNVLLSDLTIKKLDEFQITAPSIDLTGTQKKEITGYMSGISDYFKTGDINAPRNTTVNLKKNLNKTLIFDSNFSTGNSRTSFNKLDAGFGFEKTFFNNSNGTAGDTLNTGISGDRFRLEYIVGDQDFPYGNPANVYSGIKIGTVRFTGFQQGKNYIVDFDARVTNSGRLSGAVLSVDVADFENRVFQDSHDKPTTRARNDHFLPFQIRVTGFPNDPRVRQDSTVTYNFLDFSLMGNDGGFPNAEYLAPENPDGDTSSTQYLNSGNFAAEFKNLKVYEVENFDDKPFIFEAENIQSFDLNLPIGRKSIYSIDKKYPTKRKAIFPNVGSFDISSINANIEETEDKPTEKNEKETSSLKEYLDRNSTYKISISGKNKFCLEIDEARLETQDSNLGVGDFSNSTMSFSFDLEGLSYKNYLLERNQTTTYLDAMNHRCLPRENRYNTQVSYLAEVGKYPRAIGFDQERPVYDLATFPDNFAYPLNTGNLNFTYQRIKNDINPGNKYQRFTTGVVGVSEKGFKFKKITGTRHLPEYYGRPVTTAVNFSSNVDNTTNNSTNVRSIIDLQEPSNLTLSNTFITNANFVNTQNNADGNLNDISGRVSGSSTYGGVDYMGGLLVSASSFGTWPIAVFSGVHSPGTFKTITTTGFYELTSGQVRFYANNASDNTWGENPEANGSPPEHLFLEYSSDGTNWTGLTTGFVDNSTPNVWRSYVVDIPEHLYEPYRQPVKFRYSQTSNVMDAFAVTELEYIPANDINEANASILKIDSDGNTNPHIHQANTSDLSEQFTYLAWIKPDLSVGDSTKTVIRQRYGNEERAKLYITKSSKKIGFEYWGMGSQVFTGADGSVALPSISPNGLSNFKQLQGLSSSNPHFTQDNVVQDDTWQQVAFTLQTRTGSYQRDHDEFGSEITFYHNDSLAFRETMTTTSSTFAGDLGITVGKIPSRFGGTADNLHIGGEHLSHGNTRSLFDGEIGVVAIYKKALSHAEISGNFQRLRGRYGI